MISTNSIGQGRRHIGSHFSRKKSKGPNIEVGSFSVADVQKHHLQNELTILTREDHTVPIVSTTIWYRVGSRFEKLGITGISHFLEHMMFKGTERYKKGEIDYITARQGGSNNAFTSNDYTAYYFTFASDRWWPALEIEADRMRNNLFDPQEFELERQVILEELKMELDSPWGALRQAVETRSFQAHPYRFPVVGNYEDVLSITRQQMIEYYRRFYAPNNATLVVVGDFKTKELLERVEQLFGHLPCREVVPPETIIEPRRPHQVRVGLKRPAHLPRMFIAFPAPSLRQKEHYALHILDKILSEGKLSRLYRRLIEKERVASFVTTEFSETFDPHLFFIRVELHRATDLGRVEAIIFEEIATLCQTIISEEELRRAKNQCFTDVLSSFETTLDQAIQLGLMETQDCYQYWSNYAQQLSQLTAEEIRKVTQKYWTPEQTTVGILSNEVGGEGQDFL